MPDVNNFLQKGLDCDLLSSDVFMRSSLLVVLKMKTLSLPHEYPDQLNPILLSHLVSAWHYRMAIRKTHNPQTLRRICVILAEEIDALQVFEDAHSIPAGRTICLANLFRIRGRRGLHRLTLRLVQCMEAEANTIITHGWDLPPMRYVFISRTDLDDPH
jgi:hypothetical protein